MTGNQLSSPVSSFLASLAFVWLTSMKPLNFGTLCESVAERYWQPFIHTLLWSIVLSYYGKDRQVDRSHQKITSVPFLEIGEDACTGPTFKQAVFPLLIISMTSSSAKAAYWRPVSEKKLSKQRTIQMEEGSPQDGDHSNFLRIASMHYFLTFFLQQMSQC